jgi:O-antigen ligase
MSLFKPRHPYFFLFSLIILVELLSFTAYFLPFLQPYCLIVSFAAVFFLSLYSLENGVLLALVELVIGSKGHLFSAVIFNFPISLRLAIWAALMLASLIIISRQGWRKTWEKYGRSYPFWPFLLLFAFFILIALIRGLTNRHAPINILSDVNAWLYLSLIIPILLVYKKEDTGQPERLIKVFFLASLFLALKTLIFLFIFSHNLLVMPDIYLWLRRSGIGEITAMGGGWQRVFIQSQIFMPIAFFLAFWPRLKVSSWRSWQFWSLISALSLFLATIIISMSRSFWLAFALAGIISAIFYFRFAWRQYIRAIFYFVISLVGAAFLIFITVKFPFPDPQAGLSAGALADRLAFQGNEAAVASRWALLPNLWQSISHNYLLGQGFGAEVSYYSQDPRVLAKNPNGWYTSYAFEWAYLDTWLKIGFIGLGIYLVFLLFLLKSLYKQARKESSTIYLALFTSLLFLMIVNIFTPYLNHPLGLSFLLFSSCFIKKNHL